MGYRGYRGTSRARSWPDQGCSSLCHQRWPLEQQPPAAGSEWLKNKIKAGSKLRKFLPTKQLYTYRISISWCGLQPSWGGCGGRGAAGPSPVSAQLQSTLHCWAGLSTPGRSEVPGLAALAVGIALSKTKCIVGGGGNRAEWSSDYGSSTLWELWACSRTVSREGEGSWAPERTLSVLLLNAARLSCRNRRSPLQLTFGVSPGATLPHTPAGPGRFLSGATPGLAADGAERTAGHSRTPAGGSSLLGTIPMSATLTVPQDRRGQSWKKPTMECEVEYGW